MKQNQKYQSKISNNIRLWIADRTEYTMHFRYYDNTRDITMNIIIIIIRIITINEKKNTMIEEKKKCTIQE